MAAGVSPMDSKAVSSVFDKAENFSSNSDLAGHSSTSDTDSDVVLPDLEEMSDYIYLFSASAPNSEDAISPLTTVVHFASINLSHAPPPPRS